MKPIKRRELIGDASKIAFAASVLPLYSFAKDKKPVSAAKTKLALVLTGNRSLYNCEKPVSSGMQHDIQMRQSRMLKLLIWLSYPASGRD